MRYTLLSAMVFLSALPAHAQQTLSGVQWLLGCWELRNGERRTVERWFDPDADGMRGTSRSFSGANETGGERLRILLDSGVLVYAAHPSTQPYAEFRASTATATELVFENPMHDFPQRIAYRPRGTDSLLVTIDGGREARRDPVTFQFRRTACEPGEAPADAVQSALAPHYADLARRLSPSVSALQEWFVEHATPDFSYVSWTTGGYLARPASRQALERAARAAQSGDRPAVSRSVSIEQSTVLPRGDSAVVLVTIRYVWPPSGAPAGSPPERELVQRRLDRWVRSNDVWRLASAELVGEEALTGGRTTRRDGRPVPPSP